MAFTHACLALSWGTFAIIYGLHKTTTTTTTTHTHTHTQDEDKKEAEAKRRSSSY